MLRSKLGLLGLCVMALGLMAFASSASAAAPEWLILNAAKELKNAKELPAQIIGELESAGKLLTKLIGLSIIVQCTEATLTGTKLEKEGKLTDGGTVTFKGCTVPTPTGCTVSSAGAATGTIQSLPGKGQLKETSGETLIEPKTGTVFAELVFAGATCPLPTGVNEPINGVLWIKDCEGKAAEKEHKVKHLIQESTANGHTLWIGKDTAEHLETSIDGSALVFLTGSEPKHEGLSWGADF